MYAGNNDKIDSCHKLVDLGELNQVFQYWFMEKKSKKKKEKS